MKIDTLGDFNEVVEYYKSMLDLAEKIKPNIILKYTMTPEKMATHSYWMAKLRAQINNIGVSIAKNYEDINEKSGKYRVKEEEIEKAFEKKEYFYNLMKENNMSSYEVIKQIRNCLVHGEYGIELKNFSDVELVEDIPVIRGPVDVNILLNNGRIKGKINALEIKKLEYIYSDLNTLHSNRTETFIIIGDSKFKSCKNKYFLEKYLNSIKKFIIRGEKNENENKDNIEALISKMVKRGILSINQTEGIKKSLENIKKHSDTNHFEIFEVNEKKLEENKKFLEEYIKYLGLSNYETLIEKENPYVLQMFNEDVLQATFENHVVTDLNSTFCDVIDSLLHEKVKKNNAALDLKRMSYEGPIIYANMLLALGNYVCVFLKETNNNEKRKEIPLFEYHNLDNMEKVRPTIDDDKEKAIVKGISGNEKLKKIENTILDYENKLKTYDKVINEKAKKITKLNDKNPKKDELKEMYEKEIVECKEKKEHLEKLIKRLETRKIEYSEEYDDYTNLFRHLRNSIAHGTYKIDYIEALKRKDMGKIKYTFDDYPLDDIERKKPEFRLEISAENFIKIIESVQSRVNKQVEIEKSTILENNELMRCLNEKRTSQEIGEASYEASVEECDAAQSFIMNRLKEKTKEK